MNAEVRFRLVEILAPDVAAKVLEIEKAVLSLVPAGPSTMVIQPPSWEMMASLASTQEREPERHVGVGMSDKSAVLDEPELAGVGMSDKCQPAAQDEPHLPPEKTAEEKIDAVMRMWDSGMVSSEIGKAIGESSAWVRACARALGLIKSKTAESYKRKSRDMTPAEKAAERRLIEDASVGVAVTRLGSSGKVITQEATIDDVVLFLRQRDFSVVKDGDGWMRDGRWRYSTPDMVAFANKKRRTYGLPPFEVRGLPGAKE